MCRKKKLLWILYYIAEETINKDQQLDVIEIEEPIKEKEVSFLEEKLPELTEELQIEVSIV